MPILMFVYHIPRNVAMLLIRFYQLVISPTFGLKKVCKFHPTCSVYAYDAYKTCGFVMGSWKTFVRLLKCGPFTSGGYDPVIKSKVTNK